MIQQHPQNFPPVQPTLARMVLRPLERFLQVEASSGIVLLIAAVAALLWANSPWAASYEHFWHTPITLGVGQFIFSQSLHFWINDGLMTVFFLVVGLEIRREIHEGALSNLRLAALPLIAALGGVVMPAIVYLSLNGDPVLRHGWAIPTATDIAFAVGVLTILGRRVPPALRVLLLALAIIDDIAAILIIAFFYSSSVVLSGLLIVAAGIGVVFAFQRMGVRSAVAYILPGAIVWGGMLFTGLHPTLAGVILGLLTPVTTVARWENLSAMASRAVEEFRERLRLGKHDPHELAVPVQQLKVAQRELLPPVTRLQLLLHPWVAFGIMPLFALANAGVTLSGLSLSDGTTLSLASAIVLALLLGKPAGILTASWLAVKLRIGELPAGVNWRCILLMGLLGGIGFTMSIFIANLAFTDLSLLGTAKFAVLVGSTLAAIVGLLFGYLTLREAKPSAPA